MDSAQKMKDNARQYLKSTCNTLKSPIPFWLEDESLAVLNYFKTYSSHFKGRYILITSGMGIWGIITSLYNSDCDLAIANSAAITALNCEVVINDFKKEAKIEELKRDVQKLTHAITEVEKGWAQVRPVQLAQMPTVQFSRKLDGTASLKLLPSLASSFMARISRGSQ